MKADENAKTGLTGTIQKLTRLLAAPTIEPAQRAARIHAVERDIVLPLRLVIITYLAYYFFFSAWFAPAGNHITHPPPHGSRSHPSAIQTNTATALTAITTNASATNPVITTNGTGAINLTNPAPDPAGNNPSDDWTVSHAPMIKAFFLAYVALNLVAGVILIWVPNLTLKKIESMVVSIGILDAILMGTVTLLTTGYDSYFYYILFALILHNALAIPVALPQLFLNFFVALAFMVGGYLDHTLIVPVDAREFGLDTASRSENPIERLIVLVAWAVCCYGIQVLFEKQKRAEAEATEFAVRQERLNTAGHLAAEIAHNLKNPLGIITNAAFSLQRAVQNGETAVDEQVEIIREEVEHADRIITELMGYAQLAEGSVERLEVRDEVENAILEVFPPVAKYRVEIVKNYDEAMPALLMQKRHLSSVLVNIMQNAREAMRGVGQIEITIRYGVNDSVIIQIADNGPGIPPDKIDKIFEAHFSTREKGTGLGLAIVKHNTEIYGGVVKVNSELGKGTTFTLQFPSRILMRLSK